MTSSLMILALTVLVSGCGGAGKTSASLEIVNGFLVSANGFDGGLIIYGKKDTGEDFSVTLTNSLTTTIELPNGKWTFRAVGWEGDNADLTKKFSSTPRCGSTEADLSGGDMSLALSLNTAKCDSDLFAAAGYRVAGTFLDFGEILTVKSFLKPTSNLTDTPAAKTITSSDSSSSIDANMPDDLKSELKSARFVALKKGLGASTWTVGFASKCMNFAGPVGKFSPSSVFGGAVKLPTRGVPIGIELYEESDCSELLTTYEFPNGFELSSNGDHLFHVFGSQFRLILAATDIRKGYSSTIAHMPYVKCNNGSDYNCATTPSGMPDFVIHNSTNQQIFVKKSSCGSFTADPAISTGLSCSPSGDGVNVTINASSATVGSTYTLYVLDENFIVAVTNSSAGERKKVNTYKEMIYGTGASPFASYKRTFLDDNRDNNDSRIAYGRLGKVREHLSPSGAMGLFGVTDPAQSFQANCHLLSGTKDITLPNDDGTNETYRVSITSINLAPPTYVCNTSNPDATTCATALDKKIKVYNLNVSSSTPQMTFAIDCDSHIGKFEVAELGYEDNNTKKHYEQQILTWNTDPASTLQYQRYEFLSRSQNWTLSGSTWNQNSDYREMGRVFKTGADRVQLLNLVSQSNYDSVSTNWYQFVEARNTIMLSSSGIACVDINSTGNTANASKDYVLTDGSFSALRSAMTELTGASSNEVGYTATWGSVALGATTTTCATVNLLSAQPTNNLDINGSIATSADRLNDNSASGFLGAFGTFLNF